MRVGVLGTGMVGQTLSGKISEVGQDVMIGTRDVEQALARSEAPRPGLPTFAEWHAQHPSVQVGRFSEAAAHGELLVNATAGAGSLEALEAAGPENLRGKVLIDVSNPLDFSAGMPPTFLVANTDSLAEQIQRAHPDARVVKALNTVTAAVMVNPGSVAGGDHHAFVSGNDMAAKAEVTRILQEWFGWRDVIDLGDIGTARGTEMYLALWIRMLGVLGTANFNIKVAR
jgi:8-hydroxy-5-deazaflavin:NADPH oxidoreductase